MKRKNASLLGNVLMGLGLVVMVVGVGYSILNQLPQFNMPQYFAHGAVYNRQSYFHFCNLLAITG